MNQQVLARKWRPTNFDELIGQEHARKALSHALTSMRLHHAYLFTGTRGVGKTTIARILARCFNCESGVTAKPCGACGACLAISENRFIDLIEVDAASRTKVDDTRQLLENVSYAPSVGRYKIYLIDEVHMLSPQSFNALLKTLEEPPEHVIFLLATTDPHKLLPTVLSRCLQFHLRDLSPDQIKSHLEYVLTNEEISFEDGALWHLAKAGRGSMRDAMTLLDQAIAFGEGRVLADDVIQMLGVQGVSELPLLFRDIAEADGTQAIQRISSLAQETPDWLALVSGLQSLIHQVAMCQISAQAIEHLAPSEQQAIRELAVVMGPEFLQLTYQFSLTGYRDLPMANDPRSAFEMMVLRMIAFRPARPGEHVSSVMLDEPEDPEPASTEPRVKKLLVAPSLSLPEKNDMESLDISMPSSKRLAEAIVGDDNYLEMSDDESGSDSEESFEDLTFNPIHWVTECDRLGLHGMTGSLLQETVLIDANPTLVVLAVRPATARLINETHQKRIADAFAKRLGRTPEVRLETRDTLPETPQAYAEQQRQKALSQAQAAFTADPFVSSLKDKLDGEVLIETVKPREV
jgi:DNA polymerase-3 subunit gamma/tau